MDVMQGFLQYEISNPDLYKSIVEFICSVHIRNGEFECNEYIIKKMDQQNFFIYPEYEYPDGHREMQPVISIYRKHLLQAIQEKAKTSGFTLVPCEL